MTRLAWTTDIHLNFLGTQQIENFLEGIYRQSPDLLVISGDIGEAPSVYDYLRRIVDKLGIPVYFVLGNHDFYQGGIDHVRAGVQTLVDEVEDLHWLNRETVIEINDRVGMIGHDGWSDGRYGDFFGSSVVLNDYVMIKELKRLEPEERLAVLHQLGDEGADHISRQLPAACARYERVFVVTHPPPFQETCWHEGESARDDNPFLPHFTCKAIGDTLLEIAPQYPACEIIVLCGHTHGSGEGHILPNLRVISGGAEYGKPQINRMFIL